MAGTRRITGAEKNASVHRIRRARGRVREDDDLRGGGETAWMEKRISATEGGTRAGKLGS